MITILFRHSQPRVRYLYLIILSTWFILSASLIAKPVAAAECNYDAAKPTIESAIQAHIKETEFSDWPYIIQPELFTPCTSSGIPRVEFLVTLPVDSTLFMIYQQTFGGYPADASLAADFEKSLQAVNLADAQLLVNRAEAHPAVVAYRDYFADVEAEIDVTWTSGIYKNIYTNSDNTNLSANNAFAGTITYQNVASTRKEQYVLIFQIENQDDAGVVKRFETYPEVLQQTGLFGPDPLQEALDSVFATTQKEEDLLKTWRQSIRWVLALFVIGVLGVGCLTFSIITLVIKNRSKTK